MQNSEFVDFYDFLMISPQADRPMIEWAVRLMLTRYGKKNGEEAQTEQLKIVKEAYRTLGDAARREAFDREREEYLSASGQPAAAVATTALASRSEVPTGDPRAIRTELTATYQDVRLQQRIRQATLAALYDIIITRPRNPELGRAEIARAIGVRNDELEFAIWVLRERELLKTTNQGLYAITAKGVEYVEGGGVPHLTPPAEDDVPAQSAPLPAVAGGPMRVR